MKFVVAFKLSEEREFLIQIMNSFYLTLSVSVLFFGIFSALFYLSAKSGQWDDLETPAQKILTEDMDEPELKP